MAASQSHLGITRELRFWLTLLAGVLFVKAVLSLTLNRTFGVMAYGTIVYFLLLVLSTAFALRNAALQTKGSRMFWTFMAGGCGLWALDQWLYVYYMVALRTDVPDSSVADPALFLHIVPFMAAVAMPPHLHSPDQRPSRASLNFLLLLFFWVFAYAYFLFPYQYLFGDSTVYNPRFTVLYAVENIALVLALGIVTFRAQPPWRLVYLHLFGAAGLYALSSTLANVVIDLGWPYNGSVFSLAQTAAVCWFVWIPLQARQLPLADQSTEVDASHAGFSSLLAKMAVIAIPSIGMVELFRSHEPPGIRRFRLCVVLVSALLLALGVFWKESLTKHDLVLDSRVSKLQEKLSEAALVQSEDRYRDLVEHSQDLLCTHDLQGRLLSCNPAPARALGYEVSELLKIPMRELVAPEYREEFDQYLDRIKTNGTDRGWLTVVARNGERRIWEYSNTLRTKGVPSPIVQGMAHDITERKRTEKSLELLRMLIDQSNDAIEVLDPETHRFIDVNGRACLDLGYTREELLSLSVYDIDPKVDETMLAQINDKLRKSGSIILESTHRRRDGSTYPVELSIRRAHLGRDYDLTVARDITERRRADQALRESQAELARVTRIAAMGELTATIAHEINQPLAAVVADGSASLRWLAMQPPNLNEAQEALKRVIQEGNRASGVVERIRGLLRKGSRELRPLDVNEVIREVLALVNHELISGGVSVRTVLAADAPVVLGDGVQLQQVLLNLILNAIDATSMTGGRPRKLLIRSTRNQDGVLIQVQDSGKGLDPGLLDRIFEPFFTTKAHGIGMGLPIASSIVEAHGGRLWASPGSPHGAVFQFNLPAADGAS
jgi:PAS domain S-box-containing protein